nr:type I-E CRISPR-associated protein Cas6/Cse3/CasE [Hymenobacter sp. CRA2]
MRPCAGCAGNWAPARTAWTCASPPCSTVLVQSATAPDWARLPAGYLHQTAQCKPLSLAPTHGQILGFRLVANPTKKVARPDHRQGSRVALLDVGRAEDGTPAQQWLHRKATRSGFEVLHVFSEGFPLSSARASHQQKGQLPLYGARFDGLLRVTDPALLNNALNQGIGSAKAFVFRLLSLARPNDTTSI